MIRKITGKIALLIMAFCLVAGFVGCKDKDKSQDEPAAVSPSETDDDYTGDTEDETEEEAEDDSDEPSGYYAYPEMDFDADSIGITAHLPVEYTNTIGDVEFLDTDMTGYGEVFFAVMSYVGLPMDIYNGSEVSDEDADSYNSHMLPIFEIFAITGDRGAEELAKAVSDALGRQISASDLNPVASKDGVNFFEYTNIDTENYDNLDDEYKAEYDKLVGMKDDIIKNATYFRADDAVDPDDEVDPNAISFTAVDFDGNTIDSKDLFAQHEITMVNVWATWCGCCVGELDALEFINQTLAPEGCAIVGLCGDATDDDSLANAKDILASNGVTYTNLRPFDGWQGIFDTKECWPTSFFVNKKGDIISEPVSGAQIQKYADLFDAFLNGRDVSRSQRSNTYANAEEIYRVRVIGDDLKPVVGAMVQLCSDEDCKMAVTGSDGTVNFDNPPGVYEVHVRKVPEGYEEDSTVYRTDDKYCDMVITLKRE